MESNLTQTFNTQTSLTEGNETSRADIQSYRPSRTLTTFPNKRFLHTTSFSYLIQEKEKSKGTRKRDPPKDPKRRLANGAQIIKIHQWKYMSQIGLKQEKVLRDDPDVLTDQMLQKFEPILGRTIHKLGTFSIDPAHHKNITNSTLEAISGVWQRLEYVETLRLICNDKLSNGSYITNAGLKVLGRGLVRHMTTLKSLTLSVRSCEHIGDYGVKSLLSKIRLGSRNLKQLALNFDRCFLLNDQTLEAIASQIFQFSMHLQSLELSFKNCDHLTREGLYSLAFALNKHLSGLTSLSLDFESCLWLTGFDMLLDNINFENLSQLTFNFANCIGFEDSDLLQLALCLGKNSQALQELNLNFIGCNKIKNESLSLFETNLKNLISLKHFRFKVSTSFNGNCQLNIDELLRNPFGSQGHNLLQTLHLSFPGCQKLTDDGVISLGNFLSSGFSALKYLRLEFPRCGISDKGVNAMFTDIIKGLTNLEILKVDLSWCRGITLQGLEGLQTELSKRQTKLKKLVLCLFQCRIPREEVIKLKDKLPFIRNVRLS